MSTQITAPFKKQLQEQRATLLAQLATLRGGNVGRAEASAAHFGEREIDIVHGRTENCGTGASPFCSTVPFLFNVAPKP